MPIYRDADLEGVQLAGADLSRADLRGASLIALQLHLPDRPDTAATVTGLRWSAAPHGGLLEATEAFLRISDALEPDAPARLPPLGGRPRREAPCRSSTSIKPGGTWIR